MNKQSATISSPCVRNCCLDDNDICLGCFRSLAEITQWTLVDNQARFFFMQNAEQRRCQQARKKRVANQKMNIFDAIPSDLSEEIVESLVESKHIKIERIISKGHSSPDSGWYDQKCNEWVMVLKGEARIAFDNQSPVILKQGDYLTIKAHQKHKVEWTTTGIETIWLAVHY